MNSPADPRWGNTSPQSSLRFNDMPAFVNKFKQSMCLKVNVSPDTVPLLHIAVRVPGGAHRSRRQSDDLRARPRQLLVVGQGPSHFLLRLLENTTLIAGSHSLIMSIRVIRLSMDESHT